MNPAMYGSLTELASGPAEMPGASELPDNRRYLEHAAPSGMVQPPERREGLSCFKNGRSGLASLAAGISAGRPRARQLRIRSQKSFTFEKKS